MIKNNGCCDLEYAKKIKELGVKQEGVWWWWVNKLSHLGRPMLRNFGSGEFKYWDRFVAFTVAELLNVLTEIKRCDRIIPSGIDNVANFLAQEVINEKEREKKN